MEILLPKIELTKKKKDYGEFVIAPLQSGYGVTLGNSLRRVLLSSLAGAAVKTVSIEGVDHEFSALPGVEEDVIEIILALKKLRVKYDSNDSVEMIIKEKGPRDLKAGNIQAPSNVTVVNPDLHIATLQKTGEFFARLIVDKGIGYVAAEEREEDRKIGEIAIDANYAPIDHVSYHVSQTRVGGTTDYDKLEIQLTTDGTVKPESALQQAANIILKHFDLIAKLGQGTDQKIEVEVKEKTEDKKEGRMKSTQKKGKTAGKATKEADKTKTDRETPLEETNLPTRIVNILQSNNIRTIGGLARYSREKLEEVEGLGVGSVDDIEKKLKSWNIK
jgi:DNA-directed RNA polymerase subunit alpha